MMILADLRFPDFGHHTQPGVFIIGRDLAAGVLVYRQIEMPDMEEILLV